MNKGKIKIVKKTQAVSPTPRAARGASREAARQMVATVTDWVSDLKTRKSEETKAAIELLFAAGGRPSES